MFIIKILAYAGLYTIWLTPMTLIMGLIYAIKKPEKEATPYKVISVISAYLIIITLFYFS